ncbi:MAG: RNA polymerase sigma factor [Erythrobacter sp.]|uniref:RNA polymerase sigma factor n=1 Tax=Erythrobacter sp. TaxID=1042 RepID=UPI0032669004
MKPTSLSQDDAYHLAAKEYGGAIERLARGYEADQSQVQDLVQDIHTALWRSFEYFEGQCSVRSWVYRIGHNVAVSHIKASRRAKPGVLVGLETITELPSIDDQSKATEESQLRSRLLATIHRLKPADRQVMLLYLEELTAEEIGDVTGLSAGAVSTRIHRVKVLLAEAFTKEGDK